MPAFNAETPHVLGQSEAVERLKSFVDNIREQFKEQVSEMNGEWDDSSLQFSLTTYGFTITGTLNVEDNRVHVDGQLPFAAVAFRGKIQQAIEQELSRALA
ncbi:MAG: hypothetical protein CMJ59_14470 [Planctomycetaceae bacterium]|nr:hypothetical protein [Planctomycetaceae bacterium]